ncbi:MAG: hypothetical protein Q8M94_07350 [Ignavibacteria bacterium]|nr:hypothetical protein [Ignavibacteria bacterium]
MRLEISEKRNRLAKTLGYKSAKDMYQDLYIDQKLSQRQVGEKLSFSNTAIARDLRLYNIPIRQKGGYNQKPEKSLLDKITCLPIKFLQESSLIDIVKRINNTDDPVKKYNSYNRIKRQLKQYLGIEK